MEDFEEQYSKNNLSSDKILCIVIVVILVGIISVLSIQRFVLNPPSMTCSTKATTYAVEHDVFDLRCLLDGKSDRSWYQFEVDGETYTGYVPGNYETDGELRIKYDPDDPWVNRPY